MWCGAWGDQAGLCVVWGVGRPGWAVCGVGRGAIRLGCVGCGAWGDQAGLCVVWCGVVCEGLGLCCAVLCVGWGGVGWAGLGVGCVQPHDDWFVL